MVSVFYRCRPILAFLGIEHSKQKNIKTIVLQRNIVRPVSGSDNLLHTPNPGDPNMLTRYIQLPGVLFFYCVCVLYRTLVGHRQKATNLDKWDASLAN